MSVRITNRLSFMMGRRSSRPLIAAVALLVTAPLIRAQDQHTFTVRNETDKQIYVAFAVEASGGHDGLGGPGSWRYVQTDGWTFVGGSQEKSFTFPRGTRFYMLAIGHKSYENILTRTQVKPGGTTEILQAFARPKGFRFRVYQYDNTGKDLHISTLKEAQKEGGKRLPFEGMFNERGAYDLYRITKQ